MTGSVDPRALQALEFNRVRALLTDKHTALKIPMNQAIQLAPSEVPLLRETDVLREEVRVVLPSIPSPVDLRTGAVLVELGILRSLVHFFLFQTEAHRSNSYAPSGTLSSICHRNLWERFVLCMLLFVPCLSGVGLASHSWGEHETILN